ncbi:MAG: hypothetical protein Q8O56_13825 [Solirubrobacteraceae bacterium]|nr:hypothetical protein [Solirubrobacteraceae bacterium]
MSTRRTDVGPPRTCCRCGVTYPAERPGQTPLRSGWRCGPCSRAYYEQIDRRAREIILAHPGFPWPLPVHRKYDECLWCDVHRRANALTLWKDGWHIPPGAE